MGEGGLGDCKLTGGGGGEWAEDFEDDDWFLCRAAEKNKTDSRLLLIKDNNFSFLQGSHQVLNQNPAIRLSVTVLFLHTLFLENYMQISKETTGAILCNN